MDFTEKFGLSVRDNKKLNKVVDKIFSYSSIEKKMDYVDRLSLYFVFKDEYPDEVMDEIDEYLRSLV